MWMTKKIEQYQKLKNLKDILLQKSVAQKQKEQEYRQAEQQIKLRINCDGVYCLMPPKKSLHGTFNHPCVITHYAYTTGYAFSRTSSVIPKEEPSNCPYYKDAEVLHRLRFGNEPCTNTKCIFHDKNIAAAKAFQNLIDADKEYDVAESQYQNARREFGKILSYICKCR